MPQIRIAVFTLAAGTLGPTCEISKFGPYHTPEAAQVDVNHILDRMTQPCSLRFACLDDGTKLTLVKTQEVKMQEVKENPTDE